MKDNGTVLQENDEEHTSKNLLLQVLSDTVKEYDMWVHLLNIAISIFLS